MSAALRTVDWPLPEELITGFTTQGSPTASIAARYSSSVSAKRNGEVASPSSSAASRRMPSRSMVSRAAVAVGITRQPSVSSASSSCVAMASISGTIRSGFSASTSARSAARSSMSITWARCATCIAGAFG
jgi:hypothetical protein